MPCDIGALPALRCSLPASLRTAIEEADFADIGGLVTYADSSEPSAEAKKDLTGQESLLNKWHIDEYVPEAEPSLEDLARHAICFALALQKKVSHAAVAGELRIVVACSTRLDEETPNNCTVRLHRLRPENPWLDEDLEAYKAAGVLTLDWTNRGGDATSRRAEKQL